MRVALMIQGELDNLSGGYLYDRCLVRYLRRQGDDVEVISLPERPWWRQVSHKEDLAGPAGAGFDVVVQDELIHPAVWRSNHVFRKAGIPVAALVHLFRGFAPAPVPRQWLYRRVERGYLRSVDAVIANSRNTLGQARQLLGRPLPPHLVAVPGADNFPEAAAAGADPARMTASGPLRLLFAGNVIRQKGLHVLLRAMAALPRGEVTLCVAGRLDMEPAYVARIRALIHKLALAEQVTLAGPLASDQLARKYCEHQVLAVPSAHEAYGIVYAEARHFALPAIGTTAGGAREVITHGVNGYLVPPGDSRTLAQLLQTLAGDRGLLQKLSRNALGSAPAHPTWEQTGMKVRAFLAQLAAGNK